MARIGKLYSAVLNNADGLAFRDFERLLIAFGFMRVRQAGSHRVYRNERCHRPLIIQPRGHEAKAYQVREFLDMIERHSLSMDDQ